MESASSKSPSLSRDVKYVSARATKRLVSQVGSLTISAEAVQSLNSLIHELLYRTVRSAFKGESQVSRPPLTLDDLDKGLQQSVLGSLGSSAVSHSKRVMAAEELRAVSLKSSLESFIFHDMRDTNVSEPESTLSLATGSETADTEVQTRKFLIPYQRIYDQMKRLTEQIIFVEKEDDKSPTSLTNPLTTTSSEAAAVISPAPDQYPKNSLVNPIGVIFVTAAFEFVMEYCLLVASKCCMNSGKNVVKMEDILHSLGSDPRTLETFNSTLVKQKLERKLRKKAELGLESPKEDLNANQLSAKSTYSSCLEPNSNRSSAILADMTRFNIVERPPSSLLLPREADQDKLTRRSLLATAPDIRVEDSADQEDENVKVEIVSMLKSEKSPGKPVSVETKAGPKDGKIASRKESSLKAVVGFQFGEVSHHSSRSLDSLESMSDHLRVKKLIEFLNTTSPNRSMAASEDIYSPLDQHDEKHKKKFNAFEIFKKIPQAEASAKRQNAKSSKMLARDETSRDDSASKKTFLEIIQKGPEVKKAMDPNLLPVHQRTQLMQGNVSANTGNAKQKEFIEKLQQSSVFRNTGAEGIRPRAVSAGANPLPTFYKQQKSLKTTTLEEADNDDDLINLSGKPKERETESLAEFLKNTGPEILSYPSSKQQKRSSLFSVKISRSAKSEEKGQVKLQEMKAEPEKQFTKLAPKTVEKKKSFHDNDESDKAGPKKSEVQLMADFFRETGPEMLSNPKSVEELLRASDRLGRIVVEQEASPVTAGEKSAEQGDHQSRRQLLDEGNPLNLSLCHPTVLDPKKEHLKPDHFAPEYVNHDEDDGAKSSLSKSFKNGSTNTRSASLDSLPKKERRGSRGSFASQRAQPTTIKSVGSVKETGNGGYPNILATDHPAQNYQFNFGSKGRKEEYDVDVHKTSGDDMVFASIRSGSLKSLSVLSIKSAKTDRSVSEESVSDDQNTQQGHHQLAAVPVNKPANFVLPSIQFDASTHTAEREPSDPCEQNIITKQVLNDTVIIHSNVFDSEKIADLDKTLKALNLSSCESEGHSKVENTTSIEFSSMEHDQRTIAVGEDGSLNRTAKKTRTALSMPPTGVQTMRAIEETPKDHLELENFQLKQKLTTYKTANSRLISTVLALQTDIDLVKFQLNHSEKYRISAHVGAGTADSEASQTLQPNLVTDQMQLLRSHNAVIQKQYAEMQTLRIKDLLKIEHLTYELQQTKSQLDDVSARAYQRLEQLTLEKEMLLSEVKERRHQLFTVKAAKLGLEGSESDLDVVSIYGHLAESLDNDKLADPDEFKMILSRSPLVQNRVAVEVNQDELSLNFDNIMNTIANADTASTSGSSSSKKNSKGQRNSGNKLEVPRTSSCQTSTNLLTSENIEESIINSTNTLDSAPTLESLATN